MYVCKEKRSEGTIDRPFMIQGLRLCFGFLNLALTDRNKQVKFDLKRVLES